MKCPLCHSNKVIKRGTRVLQLWEKSGKKERVVQLFSCSMKHVFSNRQSTGQIYTDSFVEHVVWLYLKCLSYNTTIDIVREQYEEDVLSKKKVLKFMEVVADTLPSNDAVNEKYCPNQPRFLAFDGVWFKFKDTSIVLLVCFNPESFDIVDYLWWGDEDEEGYSNLIAQILRHIPKETIQGVYADGDLGFRKSLKKLLPEVPFQLCVVHKQMRMNQLVPVQRAHTSNKMDEEIKEEIIQFEKLFKDTIFAKTKQESLDSLKALETYTQTTSQERLHKAYTSLKRNFTYTLTHFDHPEMMRDNNLIECFNGCIKPRIKLMKSFKKAENVDRYFKLYILAFRFKPLKESRFRERRGKPPLRPKAGDLPQIYNFISFLRKEFTLHFILK